MRYPFSSYGSNMFRSGRCCKRLILVKRAHLANARKHMPVKRLHTVDGQIFATFIYDNDIYDDIYDDIYNDIY